jgi:hypothetical protein
MGCEKERRTNKEPASSSFFTKEGRPALKRLEEVIPKCPIP